MANTDLLKENPYAYPVGSQSTPSQTSWLEKLLITLGLEDDEQSLREKISNILQSESPNDTSFKPQERTMLLNILRVGALRIDDVMVPRADIIAIEENDTLGELMSVFEKAGHSRVPLFRETLDDPLGMVHIKDLMGWITNSARRETSDSEEKHSVSFDLSSIDLNAPISSARIRREVLFVPPSMSVVDLLMRMQTTRAHMALVIDEYGGTDGLVTIEDLVEEIVGEIEDEHDHSDKPLLVEAPDGSLMANARTPIEDLEERLGQSLVMPDRDDEIDTIGGLVFSLVGRVPVKGEIVRHPNNIEFEILDADPRRIKQLKIEIKSDEDKSAKKKTTPAPQNKS